ncbi:MAG TPA: HDIG domain-containing protein [Acidimicrobiia bacterium]|nr:HDIG domain-containing protein [Acidimicrobiia bacterium]
MRGAIFLATVAAVWGVLIIDPSGADSGLAVGEVAKRRYVAERTAPVVDVEETERLKELAREDVIPPLYRDETVEASVKDAVSAVFDDLTALAIGDAPLPNEGEIPELPPEEETTTTAPSDEEETTATTPAPPATITGIVFVDADGDGAYNPDPETVGSDIPLPAIAVEVGTHEETVTLETDAEGVWAHDYAGGPAVVAVNPEDPQIPRGYHVSTQNRGQLIECDPGDTCETANVGLGAVLRPISEVVETIAEEHAINDETALYLATVAADDVERAALGQALWLPDIRQVAETEVTVQLANGIEEDEEREARTEVQEDPTTVLHAESGVIDPEGAMAAAEIVAINLEANMLVDEDLYAQRQLAAAARVENQVVEYLEDQEIVDEGEILTALDIAAIEATSSAVIDEQSTGGLFAVITVLVSLIGLYLARFRPEFWSRPRMVALFGIMLVIAAGAIRATVELQEDFTWYVLPAVAFGFVTAVLFDQRIAILMALAVGVVAAAGTLDLGATVYGILAALAPIPFVSAVSSRGAFRNAVVMSSLVAAGIAAATSWFFHVGADSSVTETVGVSLVWAFGVSVIASLLGLAALQFFESAFDITTTLGLLDLTDRNHEALQMLQEKAFGTFNHSLMVGTLADAAARSIGANAILARAMAYYHDLGKTENPTFFIENQFGMSNPHDHLDPRQSAEIIRGHVTSGVELAARYNIPTDVTEGIVSHHGDGVMRFFYERARQIHGVDVDIDEFRHIGHKPRTQESAILMLADSLEAACRAVFQTEEPSPDAIEKVVDRIMDEKREDGQLSESPLTLAELTKIRQAFLDSLIGHYHQRIAYPNFPGS